MTRFRLATGTDIGGPHPATFTLPSESALAERLLLIGANRRSRSVLALYDRGLILVAGVEAKPSQGDYL